VAGGQVPGVVKTGVLTGVVHRAGDPIPEITPPIQQLRPPSLGAFLISTQQTCRRHLAAIRQLDFFCTMADKESRSLRNRLLALRCSSFASLDCEYDVIVGISISLTQPLPSFPLCAAVDSRS
jgi:hypothetical protein